MYNILHRHQKPWPSQFIDHSHPLSKGLVGAWIMNEGAGNKIYDASGNGNDGVLTSGARFLPGLVTDYDGDNDFVELGSIASNNPLACAGRNVTIATRCLIKQGDVLQRIFDKSSGGSGLNGFYLAGAGSQPGEHRPAIQLSSQGYYETTADVYDWGEMFDLVGVIRASSYEIWVNGSKRSGTSSGGSGGTAPAVTTNARIGTWNHSTERELKGQLEYVYVYNRGLIPAEIQSLHVNPYQMWPDPAIWMVGTLAPPGGSIVPIIMQAMNQFNGGAALCGP